MDKYLNNKYFIPAATGVAVVIIGIGVFLFYKYKTVAPVANNPQAIQAEVSKMVSEVGKLIVLPSGETPTIATVTDITKLKSQPFFQNAKNGDKVLIYANAKEAILYDPVLKKVLNVAPLNIGTSSAQTASPSSLPKK